jgi:hypothetical protein
MMERDVVYALQLSAYVAAVGMIASAFIFWLGYLLA